MNWNPQADGLFKLWMDQQKSLMDALRDGKTPQFGATGGAPNFAGMAMPNADSLSDYTRQLQEQWQQSLQNWTKIAEEGWSKAGKGIDAAMLKKLIDPAAWPKFGAGGFDMALERITEGPTFATLSDMDRQVAKAQKLWNQRAQDIITYQTVVNGAWQRAFDRFAKEVSNAKREPIKSGRELLDLWLATANETLLETHRTPEFMAAQQRMTRSSTDYRLQERAIAETFCELYHIPTRVEMDEAQRAIVELRREVRALKRALGADAAAPVTRAPAAGRTKAKATASAPTGARTRTPPKLKAKPKSATQAKRKGAR